MRRTVGDGYNKEIKRKKKEMKVRENPIPKTDERRVKLAAKYISVSVCVT